jgi:hypothetical protein
VYPQENGQLCLDIIAPEAEPECEPEVDMVDAVLAQHRGDYRLAIEELLLDADFLRDQLFTASSLMSRGMGRGWKPKYERV